ncbi:pyrroline-5-carboxylate reductase [Metabacillus sp. HB246100]|uniref:pyrroline-5-carboxylate reductase n=1 Tax=Bacillus weihaiensis TaxID=1547283 RepID=UPI002352C775|nr:pyrroline-5-carboxylate reductase [Bacillus weihaiensis]
MRRIGFIGAGSMAEAMVAGLIKNGMFNPSDIVVANRSNRERLQHFEKMYGVLTTQDKEELAKETSIIVLAMKPKDVREGVNGLQNHIHSHLILSVLAGVSTDTISLLLGKELPIIRAMPNTSAAVRKSATAIAANAYVTEEQLEYSRCLFNAIGICKIVEEKQLDAVTGLSGSGPAYVYYVVEAMEKAAVELGLEADIARDLIVQTLVGASKMIATSDKHPSQLRKEVMSPNGTTEAGINVLKEHHFEEVLISCIKRASERSNELSEIFEEKYI